VTTDQNLLAHITSTVDGNRLRISSDQTLHPTKGIQVVLSAQSLSDVSLRGAVDLTANQLAGESLTLRSDGAGDVRLAGSVDTFIAHMMGATDLKADGLTARNADVTLTGASDAQVTATETLKASITGAGSVTYAGHPKSVEKHIMGAGSVNEK